jgi:hypothetical protein
LRDTLRNRDNIDKFVDPLSRIDDLMDDACGGVSGPSGALIVPRYFWTIFAWIGSWTVSQTARGWL